MKQLKFLWMLVDVPKEGFEPSRSYDRLVGIRVRLPYSATSALFYVNVRPL